MQLLRTFIYIKISKCGYKKDKIINNRRIFKYQFKIINYQFKTIKYQYF